nr:EAL domain-containing protein [Cytobacillus citreus]
MIRKNLLFSEYQPLTNSSNDSIFAYEALMRTTPRINPLIVFQQAQINGLLYELDTACISNAIKEFPIEYFGHYSLFINILPTTIIHNEFKSFINNLLIHYPMIEGQIVFEINENIVKESIWEQKEFLNSLTYLKSLGFSIAFDDLPVSKASFQIIENLTPDFVKLDHTKSKGLSNSKDKQDLISLFLEYTDNKVKLVLEGIETEEDLLTAKRLGVPLLQGFYISMPKRLQVFDRVLEKEVQLILKP